MGTDHFVYIFQYMLSQLCRAFCKNGLSCLSYPETFSPVLLALYFSPSEFIYTTVTKLVIENKTDIILPTFITVTQCVRFIHT